MVGELLYLNEISLLLFLLSGLTLLSGGVSGKEKLSGKGAFGLAIFGPVSLILCWEILEGVREKNTLVWSRLMAGDSSETFAIGTLFLILNIGAAILCLALIKRGEAKKGIFYAAVIIFFIIWIVRLFHPTPHYVPLPSWLDKLIWLIIILISIGVCFLVLKSKIQIPHSWIKGFIIMTGIISTAIPFPLIIFSHYNSYSSIDIKSLLPVQRIENPGCLSCHTAKGKGFKDPGGALETIQSRSKETVVEFLKEPTKEKARALKIRENPTGQMSNVNLTDEQAELIGAGLFEYLGVKPQLPELDDRQIKKIIEKHNCLACHSYQGEGPPEGGMGGAFEDSITGRSELLIKSWLKNPSAANAVKLGISEDPFGAMSDMILTDEEIDLLSKFFVSMK